MKRRARKIVVCAASGAAIAALFLACAVYDASLLLPGTLDASDRGDAAAPDSPPPLDAPVDVPTEDGCTPGFARCGNSICNVQLSSDAKNCGACGHDCRGAECLRAVCQPLVVASAQASPTYLALDNGVLYWANNGNGTVARANVDGTARRNIAAGLPSPFFLRVSGGRVFVANDSAQGSVVSLLPDGGDPLAVAPGPLPQPRSLAVSDPYVYFDTEAPDAGTIQRVPLDGGAPEIIAPALSPEDCTLDSAYLYCADHDANMIFRVPLDGGPLDAFLPTPGPWGLWTDGKWLFWTGRPADGGFVAQATVAGSGQIFLSSTENLPRAVVFDGASVYWTSEAEGTIKRAPLDGGPVVVLASGQLQPFGIAVDDEYVYWTAKGAGTVVKVAK